VRLSGAVVQGKVLDRSEALKLWQAHAWQPASEGQEWPQDQPAVEPLPAAVDQLVDQRAPEW